LSHAECCICGRSITERFWVCEPCERANNLGGSWTEWPEWAKYLRNEERKRRRDHEIQVIPISLLNRAEAAQVDRLLYGEAEDE